MKYSKFNTIIDNGKDLLIYNSLSGALLKVSKNKLQEQTEIFKEKGILVEDSRDENLLYKYIYYRKMFTNNDLYLTIAPTTDCNLQCPYCFEEGNKGHEYIDTAVFNAIYKYILSKRERKIHLTWFGGEPLLCFNTIYDLTQKLVASEINFSASIVTNGTLLNDSIINKLEDLKLDNIQITLDGLKEEHNKVRFFKNKKGSFDLILSNIDNTLKKTSIQILLKINITRANMPSCIQLYNFLEEKYKSEISSKRLIIRSNYIRNITNYNGCENCLTEEEYVNFQENVEHKDLSIPLLSFPCPLRTPNNIIIGPDGSIYKCLEFIGNKSKSIGNITNFSISLSKLADHTFLYDPFEDETCKECSILPICGGGCPNNRALKATEKRTLICPSIKKNLPNIIKKMFNEKEKKI